MFQADELEAAIGLRQARANTNYRKSETGPSKQGTFWRSVV